MPTITIKEENIKWGILRDSPSAAYASSINTQAQAIVSSWLGSFLNFQNITLAKGTTIVSAELTYYACYSDVNTSYLQLQLASTGPTVASPTNFFSMVTRGTTQQVSSKILSSVNSFYALTVSMDWTNLPAIPTNGAYGVQTADITTGVQSLVNTYDYSNDNMMVYLFTNSAIVWIYPSGRGTSKDPELTINYLALSDKTIYRFV